MNTDIINDPRARRWGNAAKWLLLFPLGFVIAPYIFTALFGLFGLVVGVLGMVATWMLRPWVFMKAANLRLKFVKSEAAKNPVETLMNEHRQQSIALDERKKGIDELAAAIKNLDQTIDTLQREFPDSEEIPQLRQDQAELEQLERNRREDWKAAYISLGEFAKEIQRVSRLWEVSLAAERARGKSGLSEDAWMSKLRTQTSLDSIRTNLNTQLAALKTEGMQADADRILKGRSAKALSQSSQNVIDISTKTTQAVPRQVIQ